MSSIKWGFPVVLAAFVGAAAFDITGSTSKALCESQAPRVTTSTQANIFNRCTRNMPDGTVLTWSRAEQHQKDLESGVALELK